MDITSAQIEDSGILVAVRIRPLSKKEIASGIQSCCQTLGDRNIAIRKGGDANGYLKSQQSILNEYAFDAVFDESAMQEEVYESTAKRFIPNFVNGKNVTVFAYGATGAGKTHTMLGSSRADTSAKDAGPGIIPCAVKDIFEQISRKQVGQADPNLSEKWNVSLGYIEVYNEQVYDLLGGSGKVLAVREDQERGIVVVAGMREQPVCSYEEVTDFMLQGNRNRKTEATMANSVSSRSHAVLQLTLRRTILRLDTHKETAIESKLSLIDLAGSERASATNNRGARLHEGANINKSLLALANCINALSENAGSEKKANVKFRDSKLTHLLKSSLEGNCNLIMIANINPSDSTYEDSNNTLKYANRAKNIKVNPAVQETAKDSTWLERELRLRGENATLRSRVAELSQLLHEAQEFRNSVLSLCATGASIAELQRLAEEVQSFKPFELAEKLQTGGMTDSDLSFSGETSHDDSSPDKASAVLIPDTAEDSVAAPSELRTRGKRRASMSAVPLAKAAPSTRMRKATEAMIDSKKTALPVVSHSPAALLEDSEDDVAANFSKLRKRRASCVPVSAASAHISAPTVTTRQSARRGSLTSKMLASTLAAVKTSIESTAAVSASVKTSNIPESESRVTRRKSIALAATMPAPVLAPVCKVPTAGTHTEEPVAGATESESDREVHAPKVSEVDPLPRRRAIRRGSLGGSAAAADAESVRTSNRRRSIAEVTAMLASIDTVKSVGLSVDCPSGAAQDSSKKRSAEAEESASSKKKRQQQDARVDLSIAELAAPAAQVWIDI